MSALLQECMHDYSFGDINYSKVNCNMTIAVDWDDKRQTNSAY